MSIQFMAMRSSTSTREPMSDQDQKMVALGYLHEAWAEALHDGIDSDCIAQACLFSALSELVTTYGEDATAKFAEGLSARIKNGEYSLPPQHQ
jgi:hypothetical protein